MKALKHILTIIITLVTVCAHSQNITPMQLKKARLAVYDWLRDYENALLLTGGRNANDKYLSLFTDSSSLVANDIVSLPMPLFDFKEQTTSAVSYVRLIKSDAIYNINLKITDASVKSERISGNTVLYEIEIEKVFSARQKDSHKEDMFEYPKRSGKQIVSLECKFDELQPKAEATAITAEPVQEFVILHQSIKPYNSYYTREQLQIKADSINDINIPLLTTQYYPTHQIDDKKMYERNDQTSKWALFGGIGAGPNIYGKIDNRNSNLQVKVGYGTSIHAGLYRQLFLKKRFRAGLDVGFIFKYNNFHIKGSHFDSYPDTDPDNAPYLRIIRTTKYNESVSRTSIGVPIALRFDYFLNKRYNNKWLAYFFKVGITPMSNISQKAKADMTIIYGGYYDWLFNVTIDQDGIYDFGKNKKNCETKEVRINKNSTDLFLATGVSCYLSRKASVDFALQYNATISNSFEKKNNTYFLSTDKGSWNTATQLLSGIPQSLDFSVQLNYNF